MMDNTLSVQNPMEYGVAIIPIRWLINEVPYDVILFAEKMMRFTEGTVELDTISLQTGMSKEELIRGIIKGEEYGILKLVGDCVEVYG